MLKHFLFLVLVWCYALPLSSQIRLHLYFTGDLHGVIKSDVPENQGDILRIRKVMERERRERSLFPGDYLLFDTGDALSFNYLSRLDSGATLYHHMAREVGYDAMIPGDLDLKYGLSTLSKYARTYPNMSLIGSNMHDKDRPDTFKPCQVFVRHGVRIGVVGVVESAMIHQVTGNDRNAFEVASPEASLRRLVDSLRNEVDLIVALNHLDIYENLELAQRVGGIDIMISKFTGDSISQVMVYDENNQVRTAIYQSAGNALAIEHISVDMALHGKGFRKVGVQSYPKLPVNTVSFDGVDLSDHERLQEKFQEYLRENNRFLTPDHRIARITGDPARDLMDYALYTMLRSTHSEVAFLNRGALIIPPTFPGQEYLTIRDIERMSRPNDRIVIMRLNGKSIKAIINRSKQFPPESSSHLSIQAVHDYSENSSRTITPHGQKLNDDQMYAVVTNEFLAAGGDGYTEFQKGTHQRSSFLGQTRLVASQETGSQPVDLSQLLIRYLLQGIHADFTEEDNFYLRDRYLNKPLMLMKFENIDFSFKSVSVSNNEDFTNATDGRVRSKTQDAINIAGSGYMGLLRQTVRTRWENGAQFRYALQSIGSSEIQESDDRLDLQTILDWDDPFNIFNSKDRINLYSSLRYETEFTANENEEGQRLPRRKDLFFYLGISRFGKQNREIRLAFTTKNNFVSGNQDTGFELNAKYFNKYRWFNIGSILRARFLFNEPGRQPGSEKASLDYTGYAQFNIIEFISLKPQINVFVYQDMALKKTATNVQFSINLSFSRLWKPQYIRFIRRDLP